MAESDGTARDWWEWHREYDVVGSALQRRTEIVHQHVHAVLDGHPPETGLRIVSVCGGQGRELLPAIAAHPRRGDVRVRLIELDPRNVAAACESVGDLRLDWNVEVVCGDASVTNAYAGVTPADLILVCGVFGIVSPEDVRNTIGLLPDLCAPGAAVVWTRQRTDPDLVPDVRRWFEETGFREVAFESPGPGVSWVGLHRLAVAPRPLRPSVRLFTFPAPANSEVRDA